MRNEPDNNNHAGNDVEIIRYPSGSYAAFTQSPDKTITYCSGPHTAPEAARERVEERVEERGRKIMKPEIKTATVKSLKAPFPYFGGKSRVAPLVWERLGDVPNYVAPFCGSLAVELSRPHEPRIETVNDLDGYLCNFWRAIQADPEGVARWAEYPVSEADLTARHLWLYERRCEVERLVCDAEFYDLKMAGWWVWGICNWIGHGWCGSVKKPTPQLPRLRGRGSGCFSEFLHGTGPKEVLQELSCRLKDVRVCCGDWKRVVSPIVTYKCIPDRILTGVFLDPPYGEGEMDYGAGGNRSTVAQDVAKWAIENGDNPYLRIALCGYEGSFNAPPGWECVAWKAGGGYGSQGQGQGRENSTRERIWFSPHCLTPNLAQLDMFAHIETTLFSNPTTTR